MLRRLSKRLDYLTKSGGGFTPLPGVHLGDGVLTSISITDLNKSYFITTAPAGTTVKVPDSVTGNDGALVGIFKFMGTGPLTVVTEGGQLVGGITEQRIVKDGEGINLKSDVGNPVDDWLITGDSRTSSVVINQSVDYLKTDDWEFGFLNIGHATTDLDITFPDDISGFPESAERTITNSGNSLIYIRSNGHEINNEVVDYRISADGYMRFTMLDGKVQVTGNHNGNKDIDLTAIDGLGVLLDATDLSTYTAGASITSITSLDPGAKEFKDVDRLGTTDSDMEIGYNATGTPNGRSSFVFTGADDKCLRMVGDGTIHSNVDTEGKGLYACIAYKPSVAGLEALLSQYRNTGTDRTFKICSDRAAFSRTGSVPDSDATVFFSPTLTEWQVVEILWDNFNQPKAAISGVAAGTADDEINTISVQVEPLTLGGIADNNTTDVFEGELCVLVAGDTIPSDADRKLIREKLADKAGIDLHDSIIGHEVFRRNSANGDIFPRNPDDRMSVDYTEDGLVNKVLTTVAHDKLNALNTNEQTLALILALG